MPVDIRVLAVHQYRSPRFASLTPEQERVRAIAYALKEGRPDAVAEAAAAMARLVAQPDGVVLCPVPSATTGEVTVNLDLCRAIRRQWPEGTRIHILPLIRALHPVDSQCQRHRRGERPRDGHEFPFVRHPSADWPIWTERILFVDNVVTSGGTLRACGQVLGLPVVEGLLWADAQDSYQRVQGPVPPQPAMGRLVVLSDSATRWCSSCAAGERRSVATTMVQYPNPRIRHLVHRRLLCEEHVELFSADFGEDLWQETLLPRTLSEAAALRPLLPAYLLAVAEGRHAPATVSRSDRLARAAGILAQEGGFAVEWRD